MSTATKLEEAVAAVATSGKRGPRVAAFFDVDGAVIAGDVVQAFTAGRQGRRDPRALLRSRRTPDPAAAVSAVAEAWRGKEADELAALAGKVFGGKLADLVYPEARDLIAAHRRRGHTVVLTSVGTREQLQPLADALGVDEVIGTELEILDGRVTGELAGPPCTGAAKAAAVERYAVAQRIDLANSHAYGSGEGALPMLSLGGTAHPTNPAGGVVAAAEQEGWPVLRFDSRGRPSPETVLRSLAGYGMMLPSMLGGVGVGLLNRDRTEIAQYGVSAWIERLFAVTGVKLDVQGEEHLWSARPAVFIYNHRNNFDPYVAIKLVRRDWGSVAKKEIAGPLTGAMQWLTPNVAFIDRSDSAKAIEGLAPVTELLRSGVSVLVAPEGTRSVTGQLGRFKKGPFRMAMDAGVPLVPIVIHNADRVAGREAGIIRSGTIDVTVLPPVDVSDWTADELDKRIDGVRALFADTLANGPTRS